MTVRIYPNGTGGALGDELVTETQIYTTGIIYYVHHTGNNSNTGQFRQKPFATLVHALTVIADCDVIVLMDGHTETISAPQTVSTNGVKIVGEGISDGNPTVMLTSSLTDQTMLTVSGSSVALAGVHVRGGSAQSTLPRVLWTGIRGMLRGCYFECDAGLTGAAAFAYSIFATGMRIFSTKFVVTSTTTQPIYGVLSQGSTDAEFEAVTFDGGVVGFGIGGYVDFSIFAGTGPARLRCQQMRLLNGAGFLTADDTTGYLGISERTGAAVVSGFANHLAGGFRQIGDPLLADTELYMSGLPIYVHYGTGNDSNSGRDELAPKKTITGALSVTGDECYFIVCLPGHSEPLAAGIVAGSIGVTIIGCGTTDGKPSCRIYGNGEGPNTPLTTGAQCYFRNLWLDHNIVATSNQTRIVLMSQVYSELRGCLVTVGYRDQVGVEVSMDKVTVRDTKIESAGTGDTTRPTRGLYGSAAKADIDLRGLVLSNGTHGFTISAIDASGVVLTRLYGIAMSLLFGADVKLTTSTTGLLNPETTSGSALVSW